MGKITGAFFTFVLVLISTNVVFAYGYGTSSITLGSYSAHLQAGEGESTSYTVNLASGSTWGTMLSVVNNNQLASQGVMVSLSNPSGDPPYSGTMTYQTSSTTAPGSYTIILAATGDDPSTNNVNFTLNVAPAPTTPTTALTTIGGGQTTLPTTVPKFTSTPTTTPYYTTVPQNYYGSSASNLPLESSALIIAIALVSIYGLFMWKSMLTRLVILGTALILIGTIAWMYGDYAGGLQEYIWGGVAAILIGTIVWLYGDVRGSTFGQTTPKMLVLLGIALILVGTLGWVYGELYMPGTSLYWWGGTFLLVLGTLIWLYGDAKAGAFLRRKK